MIITEATPVAEIAAALPSSVRVFQRHGIDFCCGGRTPLGAACVDRGVTFREIADEIARSQERPSAERDWTSAPLAELTRHIIRTYHQPLRAELPRLEGMAMKVAHAHGGKDDRLQRVAGMVTALSDDLQAHMQKEEMILFPAIDQLSAGHPAARQLAAPIAVMEHEHDSAGTLLAELRALTDGYVPPQWGCATLRALYTGLSDLEREMHVHVHLENNILFPRALGVATEM